MTTEAKEVKKKRYHFDLGNSNKGPVGYCAAIWATSKEEAVATLQAALPESQSVTPFSEDDDVEYIEAYFNDKKPTIKDIDEVEEGQPDPKEDP